MTQLEMTPLRELDIDLLHQNTEAFDAGRLLNRQTGRTTVLVERVVGSILVAPPGSTILVLCHDTQQLKQFHKHVFDELYKEFEVTHSTHQDILIKNGSHILFSTPEILENRIRGVVLINYVIDDYDAFLRMYLDRADEMVSFIETRIRY